MPMSLQVSTKKVNDMGIAHIEEVTKKKVERVDAEWLMGVSWDGFTIAAIGISRINPTAPPRIVVLPDWNTGLDNRESAEDIVDALCPNCDSPRLLEAVALLKDAVNAIS